MNVIKIPNKIQDIPKRPIQAMRYSQFISNESKRPNVYITFTFSVYIFWLHSLFTFCMLIVLVHVMLAFSNVYWKCKHNMNIYNLHMQMYKKMDIKIMYLHFLLTFCMYIFFVHFLCTLLLFKLFSYVYTMWWSVCTSNFQF